ncbi:MAG: hypothetical protein PHP74_01835 [Candidatus Gracilibacteria bacterium]|nr:hypothetical protein [Candidatus Gracilibacteria bacterium]
METLNLATGGLLIIAVAWLFQLYQVIKINKNITPIFIIGYMIGVSMLVISGYLAKMPVSYFELGTLIAATLVLIFVLKKK